MADHGMANVSMTPEMRAFAEQSVEQAKKAFDGFMAATQSAVSTLEGRAAAAQAGVKDVQHKAVGFAEQNVAASFDFARELLTAKDAAEVMTLHADYMKAQVQALGEQARELSQATANAAAGVTKS